MSTANPAIESALRGVWRAEGAKIIATVARLVRDIGVAEELAQDAMVAALEHWPARGVPDNPAAWLTATAKHRALDHLRRQKLQAGKHEQIAQELQALQADVVPDFVDALDARRADTLGDDLLRLIFTACHPVLGSDARVALTLKLLGRLSTAEIARAFLVPEATVAQRIVRAKRSLAEAGVPFELPPGEALAARLASVLEVIYLVFNEGYTATAGDDWLRPALMEEALRLGRVLAGLAPAEPEVHGLLALMELQASRAAARVDAQGEPVLLMDQDRRRWDTARIARGLAVLESAQRLGGGPYTCQAAIAAYHARAATPGDTNWAAIVACYDELLRLQPTPVVRLNRAVAVGMAQGPHAALPLVDALREDPVLRHYQWLPSVRADLLQKLGRHEEARAEYERAAALAGNGRERALLLGRAEALR